MKHFLYTIPVMFFIACGPLPPDETEIQVPDSPLTEEESSNSRTINSFDEESPPTQELSNYEEQQAIQAIETCRNAQGYTRGVPRTICVVTLQGKMVEVNTARAFQRMANAARTDGVNLYINSGFRTMDQQRYLYNLYQRGLGNLAAYPGFSNHQSGIALDIDIRANWWLIRNAASYGFRRTVPSEDWHWEWNGTTHIVDSSSAPPARQCYSATLGRFVAVNNCVQARSDMRWYMCSNDGVWDYIPETRGCVATYPLAGSCYSATLLRNVSVGSCVRSNLDNLTYMCSRAENFTAFWNRVNCSSIN